MSETNDGDREHRSLNIEQWRAAFSASCFRCNVESKRPNGFSGRVRPLEIFGLAAADLSLQGGRLERPHLYARADGAEHYCILVPLAGRSLLIQNAEPVGLQVGDTCLLDSGRSVTFNDRDDMPVEWLAARLPRKTLNAHLRFEPPAGSCAPAGSLAGRLLAQLMKEGARADRASPAFSEPYMQLTVYDLLGALFAGTHPSPVSDRTQALFDRACEIIKGSYADPELGPSEVAVEAGVSLRYLQMLFTARGSTCTHYIQAVRLDHALRLLQVRNQLNTGQPLSQIAYSCGFRDYNYFGRAFRQRFKCAPGDVGRTPDS
jgi:AraC family transcriptional activator of tynA and feaB